MHRFSDVQTAHAETPLVVRVIHITFHFYKFVAFGVIDDAATVVATRA
jgi:hypothetical protein